MQSCTTSIKNVSRSPRLFYFAFLTLFLFIFMPLLWHFVFAIYQGSQGFSQLHSRFYSCAFSPSIFILGFLTFCLSLEVSQPQKGCRITFRHFSFFLIITRCSFPLSLLTIFFLLACSHFMNNSIILSFSFTFCSQDHKISRRIAADIRSIYDFTNRKSIYRREKRSSMCNRTFSMQKEQCVTMQEGDIFSGASDVFPFLLLNLYLILCL